jgi:hypothetical protein
MAPALKGNDDYSYIPKLITVYALQYIIPKY